jgi:hypothetical protein
MKIKEVREMDAKTLAETKENLQEKQNGGSNNGRGNRGNRKRNNNR